MNYRIFVFLIVLFALLSGCERPTDYNQTDGGIPPAVPLRPVILSAYDGGILIYWQSNNEPDLKGYNIFRSTDSTNFNLIAFTGDNSYFDDSLNYDTKYFYRITAVDIWGRESSPSLIISAIPLNKYPPATPAGLSVNARDWEGEKSVFLQWVPNQESDIAGFKIYRGAVPDFTADTSSYIGFTDNIYYSDTLNLEFYKTYFYKLKAVDKGNMVSKESGSVGDEIFEIPEVIFPSSSSLTSYFPQFIIKAVKRPAVYEIIVQDNQYFGEIWNKEISSNTVNDTVYIPFDANYIYPNQVYYWRVATFSNGNQSPNSVSPLYKFIIKQ